METEVSSSVRASSRPWIVLALAGALTVLALWFASGIRIAANLTSQLVEHPAHGDYQKFRSWFAESELLVAAYEIPLLNPAAVSELYCLVAKLRANPDVRRVFSLLDFLPQQFASQRQLESFLNAGSNFDQFRQSLSWFKLARGQVLSRDDRSLGLLITLHRPTESTRAAAVLGRLEDDFRTNLGMRIFYLLGYPVVERRIIELVAASNARLLPVSVGVGVLILYLCLTRWQLVLLAAASAFAPVLWLLGLMGGWQYRLNTFSTMLFPLTLTVGLTTTIYVLSRYLNDPDPDPVRRERSVFDQVLVPQLLCGATGALGYLSLAMTRVPILREFGIWATLGGALALLAAFTIVPAGMRLIRVTRSQPVAVVDSALAWIGARAIANRGLWLSAWGVGLALCIVGSSRLRLASSAADGLLPEDPIRQNLARYRRDFASPTLMELVVRFRGFSADHPRSLLRLQAIQQQLDADPQVESTLSAVDLVKDVAAQVSGRPIAGVLSLKETAIYRSWLEKNRPGDTLAGVVSTDRAAARILVRLRVSEAFGIVETADRLKHNLPATADGPVEACFFSGTEYLSALVHRDGVVNELWSLVGSVVSGLLVMALVLRSLPVAILCAVPNVAPLIICYGVMGFTGAPLDIATGVVGPVVFGMIVDDTIHLVYTYRGELAKSRNPSDAYRHTVSHVGRAVVVNGLTLTAGLAMSSLAPFSHARSFGRFSALTVAVAPWCDILLLPLLLSLASGWILKLPSADTNGTLLPPGTLKSATEKASEP